MNYGIIVSVILSGAVVAAMIAAAVNIAMARRKSVEEERARVRTMFVEAFEVVAQYKEFPYAIRRRRADRPEEERVRLSDELRGIQARLSCYLGLTKLESKEVGQAYAALVSELRLIAGRACHDAWLAPAAMNDDEMNFQPGIVDLAALYAYEQAYLDATKIYLRNLRGSGLLRHKGTRAR